MQHKLVSPVPALSRARGAGDSADPRVSMESDRWSAAQPVLLVVTQSLARASLRWRDPNDRDEGRPKCWPSSGSLLAAFSSWPISQTLYKLFSGPAPVPLSPSGGAVLSYPSEGHTTRSGGRATAGAAMSLSLPRSPSLATTSRSFLSSPSRIFPLLFLFLLLAVLALVTISPAGANHPDALPEPVILSILDVPDDSGGWVRVTWAHSKWDWHPFHDVRYYWLYRHVPGSEPYWQQVGTEYAQAIQTYTLPAPTAASTGYTLFMVRAVALDGTTFWDSAPDSGLALDNTAAVGDPPSAGLWLGAAYPNPTGGSAAIRYSLPEPSHVSVRLFTAAGRFVKTLAAGEAATGSHELRWDGTDSSGIMVPPGAYYFLLLTGGHTLSGRVLKVR
jgi:hypothetical protein